MTNAAEQLDAVTNTARRRDGKFLVGDNVHWDSQAQGVTKRKNGKIVEAVPAGKLPEGLYKGLDRTVLPRKTESYVVAVEKHHSRGKSVKYYWPHAGLLKAGENKIPGG